MRFARCVIIGFALSLVGCYTPNQNKFDSYASSQIKSGEPVKNVLERLHAQGFVCDMKSFRPDISCGMQRGGFLFSCIERIFITPDPSGAAVEKFTVPRIVCASL